MPLKSKHSHEWKGFKHRTSRMRKVGPVTKKWLNEDRPVCVKEWDGIDYCLLNYEGCTHVNDGYAHSLKRHNRTRPEHHRETIPACSFCHLEKLERMGVEGMAAEVRRVRKEFGLEVWE